VAYVTRKLQLAGREFEICGEAGDPYFENIALNDGTNAFLTWICANTLEQAACILDVGANVGVTALLFAVTAPEGSTYCFEPSPSAFPCLVRTLELNNVGTCRAFQLALGASPGRLSFFDNPTSAAASHLFHQDRTLGSSSHVVEVSTIDAFVEKEDITRIDLIKIDVEGFESDVLAGATRVLRTLGANVFLEFNSFTLIAYGDKNPRRFMEELLATFPFVYRFEAGIPRRVVTSADVLEFIHDNLIRKGCVDDLFCSSRAL
jgi:FkbM family methyltransferase